MNDRGFPAPRPRPAGAAAGTAEKYERYESTDSFIAVADADAEIITFSGKPDAITLTARVADALVTLTDRMNRERHVVVVLAGTTIDTYISRERVLARERTAGGGAELHVVGKWAEPADAG